MVAIAAFLIILVIIFGLENVRAFIFGTFGVVAWITIVVLGLGALVLFADWCRKIPADSKKIDADKKEKREKEEAAFQKLRKDNPELAKQVWKRKIIADVVVLAIMIALCVALALVFHR